MASHNTARASQFTSDYVVHVECLASWLGIWGEVEPAPGPKSTLCCLTCEESLKTSVFLFDPTEWGEKNDQSKGLQTLEGSPLPPGSAESICSWVWATITLRFLFPPLFFTLPLSHSTILNSLGFYRQKVRYGRAEATAAREWNRRSRRGGRWREQKRRWRKERLPAREKWDS